ncbi:MAG: AMP-binding protein [Anaerolineae bacterium]|nr:AMP-binding protein [Anaerolineae bacterium]
MMLHQATSVIEPFLERFKHHPDAIAIIFMGDDGSEVNVTVEALHHKALDWSQALQNQGIGPGDIVIIARPHSLDLIAALLGAFYTGAVASIFPYHIPAPNKTTYLEQLCLLVQAAQAQAVVVESSLKIDLDTMLAEAKCSTVDQPHRTSLDHKFSPFTEISAHQVAYLQYTSGTTGLQKGVSLSHRAILHQTAVFSQALAINPQDVIVSWLPLYHDYGLFAGLMTPLLIGIPTVLMSPFKWLRHPQKYLSAIDKYKGTLSFLPNSAHNHTAHTLRAKNLTGLDLSSLRFLANAAEPILYQSQQLFLETFQPYGFREEALTTGYGLAELTLMVTTSPTGQRARVDWVDGQQLLERRQSIPVDSNAPNAISLVSSGVPVAGMALAIVNQQSEPLPERYVGEIAVQSESLFSGYHRRPDLSAKVLREGWCYTGDLGYIADGELYVCGRKKDLIIIGGRNIHPEDIEAIAYTVPGIRPDKAAAFGVIDEVLGTEKAILVCELSQSCDASSWHDIEQALRRRIFQTLQLTMGEIHPVKKGWIIKTPNGKLSRTANRQKYQALVNNKEA